MAWRLNTTDFAVPESVNGISGGSGTVFRAVQTSGFNASLSTAHASKEKGQRRVRLLNPLTISDLLLNKIALRKTVAIKEMRIPTDEHEVFEKTLEVGCKMRRNNSNHAERSFLG